MAESKLGTDRISTPGSVVRERKGTGTARILIVDDDESFRNLLRRRLEDSYEITDTGQAAEALALALQQKPDVILLDLTMPGFSGFELCQTLASLSHTQAIPIFVISGHPAANYKGFCQNLGAVEYFEKPVDFNELIRRLADAVNSKHVGRRPEVSFRLKVILKLKGIDAAGKVFEFVTTTDGVSASGFLCVSAAVLQKGSVAEIFIVGEKEQYVGQACAVRIEWHDTPYPRYLFRFVEKRGQWFL